MLLHSFQRCVSQSILAPIRVFANRNRHRHRRHFALAAWQVVNGSIKPQTSPWGTLRLPKGKGKAWTSPSLVLPHATFAIVEARNCSFFAAILSVKAAGTKFLNII